MQGALSHQCVSTTRDNAASTLQSVGQQLANNYQAPGTPIGSPTSTPDTTYGTPDVTDTTTQGDCPSGYSKTTTGVCIEQKSSSNKNIIAIVLGIIGPIVIYSGMKPSSLHTSSMSSTQAPPPQPARWK